MQPLISVIIPVYNTQDYITRCLESVLNNTYRNLEVICVDDGSTDDSLKLLMEMAEKDPRVQCISQKNAGPSAARNRALDTATGDFIAFVDSDDWVSPFYFEKLLKAQAACDAHVICCGHTKTGHYSNPIEQVEPEQKAAVPVTVPEALENVTIRCLIWGKLYQRDLLENLRFKEHLILGEDAIFNVSIYCGNPDIRIYYMDSALYYYFQRDDSIFHSLPSRECIHFGVEYIRIGEGLADGPIKNKLLIMGFRAVLAARYLSMFDEDAKQFRKNCNAQLRYGLRVMKNSTTISWTKRAECAFFKAFPLVYRVFRLVTDRSMLRWEKCQRMLKKKRTTERTV